jgi:predicted esterase
MCTWFDAYSLGDIQEKQELQVDGIRESATYILDILENEIALLGGKHTHVYLGGISQGMATTIWTFLGAVATGRVQGPLGGVLGFCGWFPFAQQLEEVLQKSVVTGGAGSPQTQRLLTGFFFDTLAHKTPQPSQPPHSSVLPTPVFLSHGTDDDWVSVELGRQAARVLRQALLHVDWNEFTGAEGDGHWIKEPEGFDQILQFLERSPRTG